MKTKVNGAQSKTTNDTEVSKFDAIKDILFGENIKTYDLEFESVKKDILKQKNELLDIIADTRKELETAIDNLSTDLNIRITDIEDKLNEKISELDDSSVNKQSLSDLFIKLGHKLND